MTINGSGTITGLSAGGLPDASVTNADLSLSANASNIMTALNASGSAPIYACRAWVNFNGTGTVAIRASGNVTSITDNGTGDYTVNFTTAMPDVNYVGVVTGGDYGSVTRSSGGSSNATRLTSSYRVVTLNASQVSLTDCDTVYISIFR
jgi:hypothetical protein